MNDHESARRRLLRQAAAALPVLLAPALLARPCAARAGSGSKDAFHYQDHPKEDRRCADCVQFVPPAAGQQSGSCQIVDGPISANGW